MAEHAHTCLVCGRSFTFYDAAPTFFCSIACQLDAGEPIQTQSKRKETSQRARGAAVHRVKRRGP
jgi:hypothetical protein